MEKIWGSVFHITSGDCDHISLVMIISKLAEWGYEKPTQIWYKVSRYNLSKGLTKLYSDIEVLQITKLATKSGHIHELIEANKKKSNEIQQAEGDDGNVRTSV